MKYLLQFASFLYFLDIVFDEVLSSLSQVFKPRKCNHRISLVKYFRNTSHNFKCTEFLHKPGNKELPEAVVLRRSVIKVLLNNAQNSKESTCAKFTFNKVLLAFSYPALLLRNCGTCFTVNFSLLREATNLDFTGSRLKTTFTEQIYIHVP